jgi:alcohol dehydrogenase YqhD (iron-dependent ADH family)
MSIESILKQRDAFVKDVDQAMAMAVVKPEALNRPIALREARVADIATRITALETMRKAQNQRIDSDIAALKADQDQLTKTIKADRERMAAATVPAETVAEKKP